MRNGSVRLCYVMTREVSISWMTGGSLDQHRDFYCIL